MEEKLNILIVVARNRAFCQTVEAIFNQTQRFRLRTAELHSKSENRINEETINWADLIFVTHRGYRSWVSGLFRHMQLPRIEILDIDEEDQYPDEGLVQALSARINATLKILGYSG